MFHSFPDDKRHTKTHYRLVFLKVSDWVLFPMGLWNLPCVSLENWSFSATFLAIASFVIVVNFVARNQNSLAAVPRCPTVLKSGNARWLCLKFLPISRDFRRFGHILKSTTYRLHAIDYPLSVEVLLIFTPFFSMISASSVGTQFRMKSQCQGETNIEINLAMTNLILEVVPLLPNFLSTLLFPFRMRA